MRAGLIPQGFGRQHVLLLADDEHIRPRQAAVHRPADGEHGDVHIADARSQDRQDDDDQHQEREGDGDIHHTHHQAVEPAQHEAGDGAEQQSVHQRHVSGDQADLQVDARPVEHARQHIPPQVIRAEGVLQAGRLQRRLEIANDRVVRRQYGAQRCPPGR